MSGVSVEPCAVVGRVTRPTAADRCATRSGARRPRNRADWRVTIFSLVLTFTVAMLFGLAPAARSSSTKPAKSLKGGGDPRGTRRLMDTLVAAQIAFSVLVLFVAGLFISTFEHMASQSTGFSSAGLVTIESVSRVELSTDRWYQAVERVRSLPGVESAALAQDALMSGHAQAGPVWANGRSPDGSWNDNVWDVPASPGWFDTMKIAVLRGRDFRSDDEFPDVAVVNTTFARRYFSGESPVGRSFETIAGGGLTGRPGPGTRVAVRIIGVVGDARIEDMRQPVPAVAYLPFRARSSGVERTHKGATFLVRTTTPDPMSLVPLLRREVTAALPQVRVANIATQEELVRLQTVRGFASRSARPPRTSSAA